MYAFRTTWRVDAPPDRVWAAVEDAAAGRSRWWQAFRIEDPAALESGARIEAVVRAPVGYRLRIGLTIADVVPGRLITARSSGDLLGDGRLEIAPRGSGSVLRFHWDVAIRKPWMRAASPILRPVFRAAHALVMRAGERGLRRALASEARNPANPAPGSGDPAAPG